MNAAGCGDALSAESNDDDLAEEDDENAAGIEAMLDHLKL